MHTFKSILASCCLLFGLAQAAFAQMGLANFSKNALYANAGGIYQLGAGLHYDRVLLGKPIIFRNGIKVPSTPNLLLL